MTTAVRDAWSDAYAVATQDVLDPDVARVRRRIGLRRAAVIVVIGVVLAVVLLVGTVRVDAVFENLWRVSPHETWAGHGLAGAGIVLMIVGALRTTGARRPFVGPEALLSRYDRAWLRSQVSGNHHVADERRTVVADAARRMLVEGRSIPTDLGLALLYVGMCVASPSPTMLVVFVSLIVLVIARAVRAAVWSRRARRWLADNG